MNMTIGKKFTLTSAALLAFLAAVAGVSIYNISRIHGYMNTIALDAMPGLRDSSAMKAEIAQYRGNAWKHIASSNANEMTQLENQNVQIHDEFLQSMKAYEAAIVVPEDRAKYEKLMPAFNRWEQAWYQVQTISRAGKNQEAYDQYNRDVLPLYTDLQGQIDSVVAWNLNHAATAISGGVDAVNTGRTYTLILAFVGFLAGAALTFFIVKSIDRTLSMSIGELHDGADQIASAASQVSSSSQSLAQGSSEQAASLEETSASSEEINSMARKNTDNSRSTAQLLTQSQEKIMLANNHLVEMVDSMNEITASSAKISKIIKVIDEIAFQTNILALNAAVEAARAGEAGMGFAVVADEVRSLAQRSAQAAKDTAILIEDSIAKSREGKGKVDQVAMAIRVVTEDISRVKVMVDEVSLGSEEQSRGIDQISKAIVQMEKVTQTTAANAQEAAAAAEELNAQSEMLKDIVARLQSMINGGEAEVPGSLGRTTLVRPSTSFRAGLSLRPNSAGTLLKPASVSKSRKAATKVEEFPLEDSFQSF